MSVSSNRVGKIASQIAGVDGLIKIGPGTLVLSGNNTYSGITDLREGTFFAKIHLQRGDDILVIDARPSDSVALALKTNAPIFVAREVFSAHKRALEPDAGTSPGADDELRRYLKDLDPGEF